MRTSLTDQLMAEYRDQRQRRRGDEREATTTIGGTTVDIGTSETTQSLSDSFLLGSNVQGVPRGREALAAREIAETQPMQVILNAIVDQLLGGELAFPSDDEDVDQAEADLQALVADILRGPHLGGDDFDDLVAAWVADMVGPGNAYAEVLRPAGSADLPVAALKPVDPLTVRHNVDEHGTPQEPAFFQAPFSTLGGTVVSASEADVTNLAQEDLVVMAYPGSNRSHRVYPMSPAMQVREWLEVIADSTTHHSRYYSDNELPPGLLTAREATEGDIENIRDEIESAKGNPRAAPVVGTDARWVEVGGSAVDLNVIEEQKWFIQLCAAAFGIPKTELGLVEDVNRNTSEAQLSVVHKRVTQPIAETIGQALTRQLLPQFDLYGDLDDPFDVALQFSDPRQDRQQEKFVRERYTQNLATYREARNEIGVGEADDETTVTINGQTVDYGEHPPMVAKALLREARDEPEPPDGDADLEDGT